MLLFSGLNINCMMLNENSEKNPEGSKFSLFLYKYNSSYRALTRVISFTQMYEWLSMRAIIIWQSSKDLKEALYSLNDQNNILDYQKIESKIEKFWIICCLLTLGIYLVPNYSEDNRWYSIPFLFLLLLIVTALIFSYFSLSKLIQKYNPNRYDEIKSSLRYFIILETLPITVAIAKKFIKVCVVIGINVS